MNTLEYLRCGIASISCLYHTFLCIFMHISTSFIGIYTNFAYSYFFFMAQISTNEQIALIIELEVFVNCIFFVVVGLW